MATAAELVATLAARDTGSAAISSFGRSLEGVGRGVQSAGEKAKHSGDLFSGMLGTFAKVGLAATGIQAITGAVGGLLTGLVSGNAEFERYETQFGVLLGSVDKAKERIGALSKFAATTPFELPEVVQAGKVLETFGLQGEKSMQRFGMSTEKVLQVVGDAAAGSGANFAELALTFGKFSSGATGEALMRMQELGLTTREELSKMGVAFDKSGALISDKEKALATVFQAVNNRFGGMMEKQSATFEGMSSNLADWIGQTKRKLMEPVFDVLKEQLGGVLAFLNAPETMGAIEGFASGLASGIGKGMEIVGAALFGLQGFTAFVKDTMAGDIGAGLDSVRETWFQLFGVATPKVVEDALLAIGGLLRGSMTTIQLLMAGNLKDALAIGIDTWSGFRERVTTMIVDALPAVTSALNGWAQAAVRWITEEAIPGIRRELPGYLDHLLDFLFGNVDKVVDTMLAFAKELFDWVPKAIPPLLENLLDLLSTLLRWVGDNSEEIGRKLVEWGLRFGEFILTTAIPAIVQNLPGILWTITSWVVTEGIPGVLRVFVGIGKGIAEGIFAGLGQMKDWLFGQIGRFIGGIPDFVKELLGIRSPSKVFEAIGEEIPAGLAAGISGKGALAMGAIAALGASLGDTLRQTLEATAAMLRSGAMSQALELGRGVGPGLSQAQQMVIGTGALVAQATGGHGGVSAAQLASGPKNVLNVGGMAIPMFHHGGVMPWDGLALLRRGERISTPESSGGFVIHTHVHLNEREIALAVGEYHSRRSTQLGGVLE